MFRIIAFTLFEIFFRRIPAETLRGIVHKRLYGQASQGNELTKALIMHAHNGKRSRIEIEDMVKKECLNYMISSEELIRRHHSQAYNCLASIIRATQTKEGPFNQFLFQRMKDKGDLLWDLIVEIRENYNFEVETSFNLKIINKANDDTAPREAMQALIAEKYLNESFFSQRDTNQFLLYDFSFNSAKDNNERSMKALIEGAPDRKKPEAAAAGNKPQVALVALEMDVINQNLCMPTIMWLIEHMITMFPIAPNEDRMPPWMESLYSEAISNECSFSVKIFLIKIVINKTDVFRQFARKWADVLIGYIAEKQTGGKGFHYYLRDVCMTLLSWHQSGSLALQENNLVKRQCSKAVNNLIKVSADPKKDFFRSNFQIIGLLFKHWSKVIYVDREMLVNMLSMKKKEGVPDDKPDVSHLWRLTGLQVFDLLLMNNVPICKDLEEFIAIPPNSPPNFDAKFVAYLLDNWRYSSKRDVYISAAFVSARFMALAFKFNVPLFKDHIEKPFVTQIQSMDREKTQACLEEMVTIYPQFMKTKSVFSSSSSALMTLAKKARASTIRALQGFFEGIPNKLSLQEELQELSFTIRGCYDKILRDSDTETHQCFFKLLRTLVNLNTKDTHAMFANIIEPMTKFVLEIHSSSANKPAYDEILNTFFDILIIIIENYAPVDGGDDEFGLVSAANTLLLSGLSSNNLQVRQKIFDFLNDEKRVSFSPAERLIYLLQVLYSTRYEEIWLTSAMPILMSIAKKSSDYDRKLFDEPLSERAKFIDFDLRNVGGLRQFKHFNRSQPLTPIFTMTQLKYDEEMQKVGGPSQQQAPRPSAAPSQDPNLFMKDNLIRGSQGPMFSQTFTGSISSLIPSFSQSTGYGDNFGGGPKLGQASAAPASQEGNFLVPKKRYKKTESLSNMSKFHRSNMVFFDTQVMVEGGNKLRFVQEGSRPSTLQEIRGKQRELFESRRKEQRANEVQTLRRYRLGELPDIEISYKDVIDPLLQLTMQDATLAGEVLISVSICLYKNEENPEMKEILKRSLQEILQASSKHEFAFTSCLHRLLLEISRHDGSIIDPKIIADTGLKSLSYHTAALLVEESLINSEQQEEAQRNKRMKRGNSRVRDVDASLVRFRMYAKGFTEETSTAWLKLVDLYSHLGETDIVKGLQTTILGTEEPEACQALDSKVNRQLSKAAEKLAEVRLWHEDETVRNPNFFESVENAAKVLDFLNDEYKDCLSKLNKWDELERSLRVRAPVAPAPGTDLPPLMMFHAIPNQKDGDYLIRILSGSWTQEGLEGQLYTTLQAWLKNDRSRQALESGYAYEVAFLSAAINRWDDTRYYHTKEKEAFLRKWRNLHKFSGPSQHVVIERIQRIYEMEEFLGVVEKITSGSTTTLQDEHLENWFEANLRNLATNWQEREPSLIYDSLENWNLVMWGRDLYSKKLMKLGGVGGLSLDTARDFVTRYYETSSKVSLQAAKGYLRMGYFDSAMKTIRQVIKLVRADDSPFKTRFDFPLSKLSVQIKLREQEQKLVASIQETKKVDIDKESFQNLHNFLENQRKNFNEMIDDLTDFRLKRLDISIDEKMRDILDDNLFVVAGKPDEEDMILEQLVIVSEKIFDSYMNLSRATKGAVVQDGLLGGVETPEQKFRRKILSKCADFCEKTLRLYETFKELDESSHEGFSSEVLAKCFIQYTCESYRMGNFNLVYIPKLFSLILSKKALGPLLQDRCKNLPVWIFLKWLPQIIYVVNTGQNSVIEDIIRRLFETYPQAIVYLMNVTFDQLHSANVLLPKPPLIDYILGKLADMQLHQAFMEALHGLTAPEHRLEFWINYLRKLLSTDAVNADLIQYWVAKMFEDIFSGDKRYVGRDIGSYNSKFAADWRKVFEKEFGGNLKDLNPAIKDKNQLNDRLLKMLQHLKEKTQLPTGTEKLEKYSRWLDNYDSGNYREDQQLEVPGQYHGNSEPNLVTHIRVANFDKSTLVLSSIRRPKRLILHGENEKKYMFLVKGIEDLRLDQRIEQLFDIINDEILSVNVDCYQRGLNIATFQVIPMTKIMGMLEWVPNTEPLVCFVENDLVARKILEEDNKIMQHPVYFERINFIENRAKKSLSDRGMSMDQLEREKRTVLLSDKDDKTVIETFHEHQQLVPGDTLKRSLLNLAASCETYLNLRNQFIRNYSLFCIAGYILGIGDRHLENFLVKKTTGEVVGIDFGISFGGGITLGIPELMPFRLTNMFETLMQPLGPHGLFRNTMICAMQAIRQKKYTLLDCCEIFIKDPLLDWVAEAKSRAPGGSFGGSSLGKGGNKNRPSADMSAAGSMPVEASLEYEEIAWYPKKKIDVVKKKLLGYKSTIIMIEELEDAPRHRRETYLVNIKRVVDGGEDNFRFKLPATKKILDVTEQIDCLIDHARDPNILGRTYFGWSPFI